VPRAARRPRRRQALPGAERAGFQGGRTVSGSAFYASTRWDCWPWSGRRSGTGSCCQPSNGRRQHLSLRAGV